MRREEVDHRLAGVELLAHHAAGISGDRRRMAARPVVAAADDLQMHEIAAAAATGVALANDAGAIVDSRQRCERGACRRRRAAVAAGPAGQRRRH